MNHSPLVVVTCMLLVVTAVPPSVTAFSTLCRFPFRSLPMYSTTETMERRASSSSLPEYSVNEEDDQEPDEQLTTAAESTIGPTPSPSVLSHNPAVVSKPKIQYAALEPGTVVQVQVGDLSLARKAWKKRRRSGSPLLVPCSVLHVDRPSTIRWNLIYLLEKFGRSSPGGNIRISLADLASQHRSHLHSSLTQHAQDMGHETARELVEALFTKQAQESYGVRLLSDSNSDEGSAASLWLQAPITRHRAQKRANGAAILQFHNARDDTLNHTGMARIKRDDELSDKGNLYKLKPLSAALRVSQEDVNSGTVQNGSLHAVVVFDYDSTGDAGAPLLTLSLNPSRNQVRDRLKIVPDRKHEPISNPKYLMGDIKVGDGPMRGKVVRLVKGGALVDCSVGRISSSRSIPEYVKVYGLLRFQDAVTSGAERTAREVPTHVVDHSDDEADEKEIEEEDWNNILSLDELDKSEEGEEIEDISHLYDMGDDGSLSYTDPESGETNVISMDNTDDEDDDNNKDEVDDVDDSRSANLGSKSSYWGSVPDATSGRRWLHVGDQLEVFVKSVSKKSVNLALTMDSSLKGRKAKDLKKESGVNKKLTNLSKQLGVCTESNSCVGSDAMEWSRQRRIRETGSMYNRLAWKTCLWVWPQCRKGFLISPKATPCG